MAENATDLRLAAILALDVVGFSAMMNLDELGTLRRVQALQKDVIAPLADQHSGRIFKLIGDGVLANFPRVVDAFECASQILSRLDQSDLNLRIRIGIHVDYVFFEDEDVFGDGVNIAARLEGKALPGTIAISERARNDLSKSNLLFQDLGKVSLKNIRDPVRVFLYRPGYSATASAISRLIRTTRRPLIALILIGALIFGLHAAWQRVYMSPERIGKEVLSGLACSWLGLQRVAYVNGVPFLEVEGGTLQDRVTLANKIRADFARDARSQVRVDVENVAKMPATLCRLVERFKEFRYDGPKRFELEDAQRVRYFRIDLRGKKDARPINSIGQDNRLKLKYYPEAYRRFAKLFVIQAGGKVVEISRIAKLGERRVSQSDDSVRVDINTDDSADALLIIDSARPIPPGVVADSRLDVESFHRLEDAASDGNWNVELIWFDVENRPVKSEPSQGRA